MSTTDGTPQLPDEEEERERRHSFMDRFQIGIEDLLRVSRWRPKNAFVREILNRFKDCVAVGDEETGRWHATLEAANWDEDDANQGQVTIRFLVTREPRRPPQEVRSTALTRPRRVSYDFSQPPPRDERLTVFFTFTDELPVQLNIEIFQDFTTMQIKDSSLVGDTR